MIRILNFAFVAITSLVCLGVYRTAEGARVDQGELRSTRAAIAREQNALTVLGAEWARVTQPARIQVLTERHLDLSDKPAVALSSLTQLPPKNQPLVPEGEIRAAKAVVPQNGTAVRPTPAVSPQPGVATSDKGFAVLHTGT